VVMPNPDLPNTEPRRRRFLRDWHDAGGKGETVASKFLKMQKI
jgi:hypothetical protein